MSEPMPVYRCNGNITPVMPMTPEQAADLERTITSLLVQLWRMQGKRMKIVKVSKP